MANQFQTTVYLQVADGDDADINVTVEYTVEQAFHPTQRHEVHITSMMDTDSQVPIREVLFALIDTHELRKNILAQYLVGLEDDRADYLRDLRQDREMDRTAA